MQTQTILRRGLVTVPLFTVPYALDTSLSANGFQLMSQYPQIQGGNFFTGVGIVSQFRSGIPGPANTLSESITTGGGTGFDSVFDGQEAIAYSTFNGIADPTFPNAWLSVPQPQLNGNWSSLIPQAKMTPDPFFSYSQSTGPPTGLLPYFGLSAPPPLGPWMYGVAVLTPSLGPPLNWQGRYYNPQTQAAEEQTCFQLNYPFTVYATSVAGYYQVPDFNSGLTVGLVDSTDITATVPRQVCAFKGQSFVSVAPPPINNYTPIFDNPALENVWKPGGTGLYKIDVFKGGWIITMFTNGAGPTGQLFEVAICDPFLTTYNLCRFVAQDARANAQLNRVSSVNWQTKIDPNGIMYFNSGNGADNNTVAYSYSPVEFLYPDFSYTPGFINLPCYTPCTPIVMEAA